MTQHKQQIRNASLSTLAGTHCSMKVAKATVERKLSEPAVMSRWSQMQDFLRFPKPALHEFHQVLIPIFNPCVYLSSAIR